MSSPDRSHGKKIDGAAPVAYEFWDQFVRDWGVAKLLGNIYSQYRWATKINQMAVALVTYVSISEDIEEHSEKLISHVEKLKPLMTWLNEWMCECIQIVSTETGIPRLRDIGFYHLRRQNIMPIGFEMRVIVQGFTIPMTNEQYSNYRQYVLYGEVIKGERKGGVINICMQIEAHFHHIIKIKRGSGYTFEEETLDIGDEEQSETLDELSELLGDDSVKKEAERIRTMDLEGSDIE